MFFYGVLYKVNAFLLWFYKELIASIVFWGMTSIFIYIVSFFFYMIGLDVISSTKE